jgi:hypothetical protein
VARRRAVEPGAQEAKRDGVFRASRLRARRGAAQPAKRRKTASGDDCFRLTRFGSGR